MTQRAAMPAYAYGRIPRREPAPPVPRGPVHRGTVDRDVAAALVEAQALVVELRRALRAAEAHRFEQVCEFRAELRRLEVQLAGERARVSPPLGAER